MTDRLFNLQPHSRRRFARHFLNSVHCELGAPGLQLEQILENEQSISAGLAELGYRGTERVYEGQFRFSARSPGEPPELSKEDARPHGLQYRSEHPRRLVRIVPGSIIFSDFAYEGFESFHNHQSDVLNSLEPIFGAITVNKTGLRKINSLIIDPVDSYIDACAIFNLDVFGLLRGGIAQANTVKATEETLVLERDEQLSVIRLQFRRADTPKRYEAILDFDIVDRNETSTKAALEILPQINQRHFDLFMWSISDQMITMLDTEGE